VHDARGGRVLSRAAELLRHGEPQEPELAELPEKRKVESLQFVVLGRLRLELVPREGAHHLAQEGVFLRGVIQIEFLVLHEAQA